jgi:hypothetical protein
MNAKQQILIQALKTYTRVHDEIYGNRPAQYEALDICRRENIEWGLCNWIIKNTLHVQDGEEIENIITFWLGERDYIWATPYDFYNNQYKQILKALRKRIHLIKKLLKTPAIYGND